MQLVKEHILSRILREKKLPSAVLYLVCFQLIDRPGDMLQTHMFNV